MANPRLEEIGTIRCTHGVAGELRLQWDAANVCNNKSIESVFLRIDGIPIPFFVESIRAKGVDCAIIKLDDISTPEQASRYVGCRVLADGATLPDPSAMGEPIQPMDELVGFSLISAQGVMVGEIVEVNNYSGNIVFTLNDSAGRELMVPAAPELIDRIDSKTRSITIQLPNGLLDLFLG